MFWQHSHVLGACRYAVASHSVQAAHFRGFANSVSISYRYMTVHYQQCIRYLFKASIIIIIISIRLPQ
jgi:hypothetical protein